MSEPVYRVLVVDDDPNLAAGVAENLRAEGYEVDSVGDGRKAVDWFDTHSCDLIVLDVMLPGLDGFGVCSTLRGRGTTTPVLFLTALGEAADRIRGRCRAFGHHDAPAGAHPPPDSLWIGRHDTNSPAHSEDTEGALRRNRRAPPRSTVDSTGPPAAGGRA